jgi:hypothetical protein
MHKHMQSDLSTAASSNHGSPPIFRPFPLTPGSSRTGWLRWPLPQPSESPRPLIYSRRQLPQSSSALVAMPSLSNIWAEGGRTPTVSYAQSGPSMRRRIWNAGGGGGLSRRRVYWWCTPRCVVQPDLAEDRPVLLSSSSTGCLVRFRAADPTGCRWMAWGY